MLAVPQPLLAATAVAAVLTLLTEPWQQLPLLPLSMAMGEEGENSKSRPS